MLNVICVCLSVISMVCCIYCVIRYKDVKADRDDCFTNYLRCCGDLDGTIKKWGKTIDLCNKMNGDMETINRYNLSLIDINADLRLELNKLKEKQENEHD